MIRVRTTKSPTTRCISSTHSSMTHPPPPVHLRPSRSIAGSSQVCCQVVGKRAVLQRPGFFLPAITVPGHYRRQGGEEGRSFYGIVYPTSPHRESDRYLPCPHSSLPRPHNPQRLIANGNVPHTHVPLTALALTLGYPQPIPYTTDLSESQTRHAAQVLEIIPRLQQLRYKICPSKISEQVGVEEKGREGKRREEKRERESDLNASTCSSVC